MSENDEATFVALAQSNAIDDDSWPARPRRTGLRMRLPTAVLGLLVVAAGAFWGGAAVQKASGTGSTGAAASRLRSLFASAGGASSFFGRGSGGTAGAGGLAPAATGTLTAVVGNTLYLTSSSGALVKVQMSPSTTVTRTAKATSKSLQPGDTIVVRGTTASSGAVTATSVTASAKGVTPAGGAGFGGLGGGGGSGTATGGFGGSGD